MKAKIVTLFCFGLMASAVAQADVSLPVSGDVKIADCALLSDDVQINLSSNVVGAVACDATQMIIATCHIAGRQSSRSVEKLDVTDPANPVSFDPKQYTVTEGSVYPYATTLAGTVVQDFAGTVCDATTVASAAASHK